MMDFGTDFGVAEMDGQLFWGSEANFLKSIFDGARAGVREAVEIASFSFTPILCCFVEDSAWGGVLCGPIIHVLRGWAFLIEFERVVGCGAKRKVVEYGAPSVLWINGIGDELPVIVI